MARVISSEELGTMSKNNLRRITLVRGPIWGIHSLTLVISWLKKLQLVNKQLLDEVEHDIMNYQTLTSVLSIITQTSVLIIHDIMQKTNSIIVLSYIF